MWAPPKTPMKIPLLRLCALGAACLLAPLAFAATADGLSSYGLPKPDGTRENGIEEPEILFYPEQNKFLPTSGSDPFVNLTNVPAGFRATLRYNKDAAGNGDWWDGDRRETDASGKDRQRAEVKDLGVNQANGQAFEYTTTIRTSPGFRPPGNYSGRFCHIFQLKGRNGSDYGFPQVTISLFSSDGTKPDRIVVKYAEYEKDSSGRAVKDASGDYKDVAVEVLEVPFVAGRTYTLGVRIKTSSSDYAKDGYVLARVDGGAWQGRSNTDVFRLGCTQYRPKWGLYRSIRTSDAYTPNDWIEHTGVSAGPVTTAPVADFSLSTTTTSETVTTGSSTFYTVRVGSLNNFAGVVGLSVSSGLPTGTSAVFSPISVTQSGDSKLTLSTSSSTPPGDYNLTITGTSGSLVKSTNVRLSVVAQQQVAAPVISPDGGSFTQPQSVTLSTATSGASIRYTLNGSDPTADVGTLYSSPIAINSNTVVRAVAFRAGMTTSAVTSRQFTFKQAQTISFPALASRKVGDASFAPGATASSGLPVSYTSSNGGVAVIQGGIVQIVGAGTTEIVASQAGDATYAAAASVSQTLTVLPSGGSTVTYYRLKVVANPTFVLNVGAASGSNYGVNVFTSNGSNQQLWKMTTTATGVARFSPRSNPGYSLEYAGASATRRAAVQIAPTSSTRSAQQWRTIKATSGAYMLAVQGANFTMDCSGTPANNVKVQLWDYSSGDGNTRQQWILEPVSVVE
jgi:hypothetical protein